MVPLFAGKAYKVSTNRGEREVVIPDGSTALDVLLTLAKNYYNLSYDHEDLLIKTEQLTKDIDEYLAENKNLRTNYNELIIDYAEIVEKYKKMTGVTLLKGVAGAGVSMNASNGFKFDGVSLYLGASLFEKIQMLASFSYSNTTKTITPGIGLLVTF